MNKLSFRDWVNNKFQAVTIERDDLKERLTKTQAQLVAAEAELVSYRAHMQGIDAVLDKAAPCTDIEVSRSSRVRGLSHRADAAEAQVKKLREALESIHECQSACCGTHDDETGALLAALAATKEEVKP